MKKFLAILLALALVVTCFAACGSDTGSSSAAGESSTGTSSAAEDGSSATEEETSTDNGDLPTIT